MPQLNFYVPQTLADELRRRARSRKIPVSRLISEIVRKEVHPAWPPGWRETFGSWKGEFPEIDDPVPEPIEPIFE